MKKALIAMSGGVDSSVAAFLMKKKGFECIGATMKLHNRLISESSCCTEDDIRDAAAVCEKLGMEHHTFDFESDFISKVVEPFIAVYENGGTPNPCIECNRYLKFEALLDKMQELGYDYIVTGHYAEVVCENGRYLLKKGRDASKDQSYVLYSLTQEQLSHIILPLSEYSKDEIRKIALNNGLSNALRKDSQDICFVPDGDYAGFIEKYRGRKYPKGDFIDKQGNYLGKHGGIIRYTIGQRKGLNIALGHPVYVIFKDIRSNTVTLGTNDDLLSRSLTACDFNWISPRPDDKIRCCAKTRYNMREVPCTACCDGDRVVVEFDEPVRAITAGQAVVLYDGDYVLGGGTII